MDFGIVVLFLLIVTFKPPNPPSGPGTNYLFFFLFFFHFCHFDYSDARSFWQSNLEDTVGLFTTVGKAFVLGQPHKQSRHEHSMYTH